MFENSNMNLCAYVRTGKTKLARIEIPWQM